MLVMTEHGLAELLRVSLSALRKWRAAHRIHAYQRGRSGGIHTLYHEKAINLYLKGCATDTGRVVTLRQLLAYEKRHEKPSLLTIQEVAQLLGRAPVTVRRNIREQQLPALSLSQAERDDGTVDNRALRVPAALLELSMAAQESAVHLSRVMDVFGLHYSVVYELYAPDGPLDEVTIERRRSHVFVTEESFLALLAGQVRNCTAQEWLALRDQHGYEELLNRSQVIQRYHVDTKTLTPLLATWPHLVTPGSKERMELRIPLHVVEEWAQARTVHIRKNPPLTSQQARARGMVVSDDLLDEIAGMTHADIVADIAAGLLPAIPLPRGRYAIEQHEARAYRRRLQRELNPDYHRRFEDY